MPRRRLIARPQDERREPVTNQPNQPPVPAAPPGDGVVNVSWQGDTLVIVERLDGELLIRQRAAEYSCFVRGDLPEEAKRIIRNHPAVKGMKDEGEWTRVYWRSKYERKDLCSALAADGVETFEGDVNPVRRYCTDTTFKRAPLRIAFLDIETDSRVPPRLAAEGQARILAWSIVNEQCKVEAAGLLDEDSKVGERKLLRLMLSALEKFDLVVAWNGDHFDFPAIRARAQQCNIPAVWDRWLWLDQMDLFKRMNNMAAESGEEKTSYALQAIATALLGEGKDDFDASKTWEAWEAGGEERDTMFRYCQKDTILQARIELKVGYIGLLSTLAETCNVFPDSRGMNPTIQAEGFLLSLGAAKGYRFPTSFPHYGGDGEAPFKGAYVMEPKCKGITKNVHVGDFASLYPSIIVTWNMSPETLVAGEEHDELLRLVDSGVAPSQLTGFSYAPLTQRFFRTGAEGILPHAVKEVMRLRKAWNDEKAHHPPGSPAWVEANRKSTAYKIAANSFYGVIGSPSSRFFSRFVAESTTQCGAWLIHTTIDDAEARCGMKAVYGDTDSLFIAGCTRAEFERFTDECNHDLYPDKLKALGCTENLIKLAYEKEFERVVFTAAKKYVGRFVHYKGKDADATSKPEVKGLEYKRGDSIRMARQLQSDVVDLLVGMVGGGCEDPEEFATIAARWQSKVLYGEVTLDELKLAKGLNRPLNEYARKRKANGEWAKQLPHVELARKLYELGYDISEGTKIVYFIYDASGPEVEYRIAEEWDGTFDRFETWEKSVWPPTERLLAAAFPDTDWRGRFGKVRPKVAKAPSKRAKAPAVQGEPPEVEVPKSAPEPAVEPPRAEGGARRLIRRLKAAQ